MFYEMIYMQDGMEKRVYPQSTEAAQDSMKQVQKAPGCTFVSIEACRNEDAYRTGQRDYRDFVIREAGLNSSLSDEDWEERWDDVIEQVVDAPFEYDKDVAYYILCENESFKAANDYYREVTA